MACFTVWGGQLPSEAIVCFANTGKEDEATLRFVQDCSEHWNVPITWLEYRAEGYAVVDYATASRNGEPFEALIEKNNICLIHLLGFALQNSKLFL